MNAKTVDKLNIGLIGLALLLAYWMPFSLFIYAYAFIGPLHYLTEINWLHDRKYFVQDRWWLALVLSLCALLVIPRFFDEPFFPALDQIESIKPAVLFLKQWSSAIIFFLLVLSVGILSTTNRYYRWILACLAVIMAYVFQKYPFYGVMIGLLVPTLIHVYLFTLLFMIFGNIKSKSRWGWIAAGCMVIAPILIIWIDVNPLSYQFIPTVQKAYIDHDFHMTNIIFTHFIGLTEQTHYDFQEFFQTKLIVKMQIFIAFAYLYHYLNWFSKTTVIGWHKNLTTQRSLIIGGIWLIIALAFLYQYTLGFYLALFFSFLHVFLEFPLNWLSIKAIFTTLKSRS